MARVTILQDNVDKVMGSLTALVGKQVLIGIPESETERDDDGPITNAALGYIHEFGAPESNIPARPFLIPGVQAVEEQALDKLRQAADAALTGDTKASNQYLQAAGIIGEMGAKDAISGGDFVPLKPETIANRHRQRRTASLRQDEIHYLALVDAGMTPEGAQNATGIRALINTGQLRNSLTHVVRRKGKS
jgi:hypothetical protein